MKTITWMRKRPGLVWFVVITLLSFCARLLLVNDGLFHHDSVQVAVAVEQAVTEGNFQGAVHGRYGLVLLYALAFLPAHYLLGAASSEFTITLVTMALSSLAPGFFFLFVKRLTGQWFAGLSAGLLLSFNPVFFSVTTYAKSHGPAVFFVTLAGYALVRALQSQGWRWWGTFVWVMLFAVFVRAETVLFLAPALMLAFWSHRLLGEVAATPRHAVIAFLSVAPLIGIVAVLPFGLFSVSSGEAIPFHNLGLLLNLLLSSLRMLLPSLGFFVAALVSLSLLMTLWKRQWWVLAFLAVWFGATFLPLAVTSVAAPRHQLLGFLPLLMMAGLVLASVYRKQKILGWVVMLLVVAHSFSLIYPVVDFRHEMSGPKEYAMFVRAMTPGNAMIVANDNAVFLNYYAKRETMGYPYRPSGEQVIEVVSKIHDILDEGRPVYVSSRILGLDERDSAALTLQENFNLRLVGGLQTEDYHRAELRLRIVDRTLYQVGKKEGRTKENILPFYFR